MRAVIQRVSSASVEVQGPPRLACESGEADRIVGQIGRGLLVYLSVGKGDEGKDAEFIANKISGLRMFSDEAGKMNLSLQDVGGAVLLVSNFTLHGDCRKGRRPGFDAAGLPEAAKGLYEKTAELIADKGIKVATGIFGAYMQVNSVNDGPATFLLDSTGLL